MSTPTVSIITPSYNSASHLYHTAESVFSQTMSDWEWLITDDASTDSTWELLEYFARNDSRVKPQRNNFNQGASCTRNSSIRRAEGKFLAFLDSDDIWQPQKLARHLEFMSVNNAKISFTAYEIVDENGCSRNKFIDMKDGLIVSYQDMLCKKANMGCSTVVIQRLLTANELMPDIRTGQDYGYWLNLLKKGEKAYCLSEPLTKYKIRANSISRNKLKKALRQWQIYRDLQKLGGLASCWYFVNYAFRAIVNQ